MAIQRRSLLQAIGTAGLLSLAGPREQKAQEQAARATRALPIPKIKDIGVIECQPNGVRLTVVKITTDQDGLYGYGCATFTQRAELVKPAVERYLKPFLLGKTTDRIEDIWQSCYDSSYWKNGPVLNNAISGVDQALWDIKGRQAGMPVYQLAGGKCREAVDCYMHAAGAEPENTIEAAKRAIAQGFRYVRVQVGVPGMEEMCIRDRVVVCLFATLAPFLVAQTAETGTLMGKLVDASGAAVANAKVTAVSADTGQAQTATTGADGVYRFTLPPGNYRVKFEAAGFVSVEIPSTTVPASGAAVLDRRLEVGAQSNEQTTRCV